VKTFVALITVVAGLAVGGGSASAGSPHFPQASLRVDSLATQLHLERIYWVGPDGQTYPVDRWYEWTVTVRWSHLPATVESLRIEDPAKDQFVTVDVTGSTSYTFSGTYANAFWAFPDDTIALTLNACLKPSGKTCLQYVANAQVPS
jgi:hypothetical protein